MIVSTKDVGGWKCKGCEKVFPSMTDHNFGTCTKESIEPKLRTEIAKQATRIGEHKEKEQILIDGANKQLAIAKATIRRRDKQIEELEGEREDLLNRIISVEPDFAFDPVRARELADKMASPITKEKEE